MSMIGIFFLFKYLANSQSNCIDKNISLWEFFFLHCYFIILNSCRFFGISFLSYINFFKLYCTRSMSVSSRLSNLWSKVVYNILLFYDFHICGISYNKIILFLIYSALYIFSLEQSWKIIILCNFQRTNVWLWLFSLLSFSTSLIYLLHYFSLLIWI